MLVRMTDLTAQHMFDINFKQSLWQSPSSKANSCAACHKILSASRPAHPPVCDAVSPAVCPIFNKCASEVLQKNWSNRSDFHPNPNSDGGSDVTQYNCLHLLTVGSSEFHENRRCWSHTKFHDVYKTYNIFYILRRSVYRIWPQECIKWQLVSCKSAQRKRETSFTAITKFISVFSTLTVRSRWNSLKEMSRFV